MPSKYGFGNERKKNAPTYMKSPAKHIISDKSKSTSGWRHEGHEAHNYKHNSNPSYDHGTSKEKFDYV